MESETVSVKIGKDVYERVKALAERDYRPIRNTIELLLAEPIARATLDGATLAVRSEVNA